MAYISSIAFVLIVVIGIVPSLQTTWVTSAMTTLNHQWLATAFISETRINEIMKDNYVFDVKKDSSILNSDNSEKIDKIISDIKNSKPVTSTNAIAEYQDPYLKEGYEELSEGVYHKKISGTGWHGNLMLISDPRRIRVVGTPTQYKTGTTVKKMIESVDGIAGINGGGFADGPNYDSNGGVPIGIFIQDSQLISPNSIENKTKERMIGLKEGKLVLYHATAQWAIDNGIEGAVTFGPFLIIDGEPMIKGTGGWGLAPRTAIGQRETGEIIFITIDGRQPTWSIGVDLNTVQDELVKQKCFNASLLDGGSSSVMIFNGEFLNKPNLGHERYINNSFVVTKIQK